MLTLPTGFASLIGAFAPLFTKKVFESVQVLLAGAILATGKRTVTALLRVMGLAHETQFQTYHRVLNRPGGQRWRQAGNCCGPWSTHSRRKAR